VGVGPANKINWMNDERANEREREEPSDQLPLPLPFSSSLSPPFIGEVGEEVLFMPLGGICIYKTLLRATNGPLEDFVFTKRVLRVRVFGQSTERVLRDWMRPVMPDRTHLRVRSLSVFGFQFDRCHRPDTSGHVDRCIWSVRKMLSWHITVGIDCGEYKYIPYTSI
jgi:hypothetical protein